MLFSPGKSIIAAFAGAAAFVVAAGLAGDAAFAVGVRFADDAPLARVSSSIAGGGAADAVPAQEANSMTEKVSKQGDAIGLPPVPEKGGVSLEEAIRARRSVREFSREALDLEEISALLWAAQGITERQQGLRAAPSAGATYPLELYLATAGYLARYDPESHSLVVMRKEDKRAMLAAAALGQPWVESAPAVFIFAADVSRTSGRYGGRADRYVHIEVGCASENLMLQAAALGLGSVAIGAYKDGDVAAIVGLPKGRDVFLMVPVGRPAE